MTKAYPLEFRKQVVDFIDENPQISLRKVGEKFDLNVSTVCTWNRQYGRNRNSSHKRKFTNEQLLEDLRLYPHDNIQIRKIRLGGSSQNISHRIRKLGLQGRARYRLDAEKKQHEMGKKKHLAYIISKIQYAVDNPSSLEEYPQTLENWLKVLLKEVQELTVG